MSRSRITALVIAVAVAVAGGAFLLTRGGESSPEESASNEALSSALALGSREAEAELARRSEELQEEAERKGATSSARELRRGEDKVDRIDDLQWRAFNEQFRKTPFDKGIDQLPMRKPPLEVEQWITDLPPDKLTTEAARERFYRMSRRARAAAVRKFYRTGPKKLYARIDEDRWYRMSQRERAAAVRAFYRNAEKIVKKKGIRDFVLVVTPLTKTIKELPAFAVGRDGSVSITPLGRSRPKPGI